MQAEARNAFAHMLDSAGARRSERRLSVGRVIGSLYCFRRTHAGLSLRTTLAHPGRSDMERGTPEELAALVGLAWADAKHDVC
jgi:hypothetical protein